MPWDSSDYEPWLTVEVTDPDEDWHTEELATL